MRSTSEALAQLRAANPVPATYATMSEARGSTSHGRGRTRAGLLVAATAGVAAVAVGIGVLPGGRGGASPAAAAALDQAATAADITATDEAAGPDQYWRIETDASHLTTSVEIGSDAGSIEDVSTWLGESTRVEYVAVDGARPSWFQDGPRTITQVFSGQAQVGDVLEDVHAWTTNLAPNDTAGSWQQPNAAWLAALPRETDQLRDRLYADTDGHGRSRDGEVLVYVADLLRSGMVPADLRAALFRVLESVPGVELVRRHEDGLISIGRLETVGGERQDIVIDPATGAYVGEQQVQTESVDGLPAGTVTTDTSVTTTVVDEVPADVRDAADRMDCTAYDDGAIGCENP